jgi:hypothetical protein
MIFSIILSSFPVGVLPTGNFSAKKFTKNIMYRFEVAIVG